MGRGGPGGVRNAGKVDAGLEQRRLRGQTFAGVFTALVDVRVQPLAGLVGLLLVREPVLLPEPGLHP